MHPEIDSHYSRRAIHLELSTNRSGKFNRVGVIASICMALIAMTLAVYLQVGRHQFLNFDDNVYVTDNAHVTSGLTAKNIVWAFSSLEAANWHPLTWISHQVDVQLFGLNPRGHHLSSVALHTFAALLLFLLLLRSTRTVWPSAVVAALFALHPLHVESVAWVAERKDVLSGLFWFLTLLVYSAYAAKPRASLYLLTLLSFVLGLMCKPMLVTLPLIMLLMDYWPLNRFCSAELAVTGPVSVSLSALLREKAPFVACSLASGLITIHAQHAGGALDALTGVPLRLRLENALTAYVTYLGKAFWPHGLAVFYPFPAAIPLWQVMGALFVLLFISAAVLRVGRRRPYLAFGWFWYLITLLPVIGLLQVGAQSMADRYTYIPLTGLFIMLAWGVQELTKGLRYRQALLTLLAGAVIVASAAVTRQQLTYWQDNSSLYRHALRVTSANAIITNSLGLALQTQGDLNGAIHAYRQALQINPNDKDSHNNLGIALASKGDLDGAMREYRRALQIATHDPGVHNNLGVALQSAGNLAAAIQEFGEALRINPRYMNAHFNRGAALHALGELDGAIQEYQQALLIEPNDRDALRNLGVALAQKLARDEVTRK